MQAKLGTLWVTTSNPTRPVELVLSDDRGLVEVDRNQGAPPTPPLDARPCLQWGDVEKRSDGVVSRWSLVRDTKASLFRPGAHETPAE